VIATLALAGCAVANDSAHKDLSAGGGGDLSSPCDGGHLCGNTGECVAASVCCSSADCTVTGQSCPGLGGTCACPAGKHVCTASNSCIPDGGCCVNADCPNGRSCTAGMCTCGAGCCADSDCPATSQTTTTSCNASSGMCAIGGCNAGWLDVNASYADGCECNDTGFGLTCGTRTPLNTVAVGGMLVRNGNLPSANEENWFSVTFAYTAAATYHPRIQLTAAAGTTMLMDLSTTCNAATCGLGGATAVLDWESKNGGDATAIMYVPTPSVGTMFIRVYQTAGPRVCASYTLTITN